MLDAAAAQARPHPADDVSQIAALLPQPSGDAYQTGRGLLAAGDITGAIAAFRQAIVVDPRSVDALNGLAVAYDRIGRYDLSRALYDSALAIDPGASLVANNLGYSLYLQGQYRAAIPWLQRATASADPVAVAGGQRLLNLIGARLQSDAAEASTAMARAEIGAGTAVADGGRSGATAPGVGGATLVSANAHIQVAGNGEQRLVLDATPVDRALLASLGDDAALAEVPRVWTRADDRVVVAEAALQDREIALAGTADLTDLVMAEDAESALTQPLSLVAAATMLPAPAFGAPRAAPSHAFVAADDVVPHSAAATSGAVRARMAAGPGWLLASRATARAVRAPASTVGSPEIKTASGFDSDDHELNAFAARMRAQSDRPQSG